MRALMHDNFSSRWLNYITETGRLPPALYAGGSGFLLSSRLSQWSRSGGRNIALKRISEHGCSAILFFREQSSCGAEAGRALRPLAAAAPFRCIVQKPNPSAVGRTVK